MGSKMYCPNCNSWIEEPNVNTPGREWVLFHNRHCPKCEKPLQSKAPGFFQKLFVAGVGLNKEKNEKVMKTNGRTTGADEVFRLKGKWQCPKCKKPIVANPNLGVLAYFERAGINKVIRSPLVCEHCGATVTIEEAFHGKFKK